MRQLTGRSLLSEKFPTCTSNAALALSVSGSCTISASSLFGSWITRYDRLSRSGCSSLLVMMVAPPEGIVISFILVVIVVE